MAMAMAMVMTTTAAKATLGLRLATAMAGSRGTAVTAKIQSMLRASAAVNLR